MINAQAWSGEITWDLLLGTNTVRNLHFNAPISMSLQNEGFTLSLACDSYSIAQADSAIAAALVPYETAAQRDAAIAAALTAYGTTTETNAAIAAALVQYYTAAQVDTQIDNAVAGIDLSPYYTSALSTFTIRVFGWTLSLASCQTHVSSSFRPMVFNRCCATCQ